MSRLQQALLAAVAVVVLIGASLHYVIVDVDEHGPGGKKLWLPVPIELAQLALWFLPDDKERVEVPAKEIERYRPLVDALLDGLEDIDEVDLVQVEDGDQTVLIRKAGGSLEVNVRSSDEDVRVRVSMRTLRGLADSFEDGRFDVGAALRALKHSSGPMVYVTEPGTKVSLAIW